MWRPDVNLASANAPSVWTQMGKKFFELSNHLGNVMSVISDEVVNDNGTYKPTVISANDYYASGGQMGGRSYNLGGSVPYSYGFNGKENDAEVNGQQDYGMRIYDARLGRFKSVDPITAEYPELTPYQFASNTPIQAIDLDGLEEYHYTLTFNKKNGVSVLTKTSEKQLASTNLFGVPYPGGQVKRAVVQYDKKMYHIGFGRGDDLTTFDIFKLWKTKPNAKLFESLFPSDEDRMDAELMKFYRQNQDMLVSVLTSAVPLGFINFEPVRPLQNNKPGAKQINKEVQNISEGKRHSKTR